MKVTITATVRNDENGQPTQVDPKDLLLRHADPEWQAVGFAAGIRPLRR